MNTTKLVSTLITAWLVNVSMVHALPKENEPGGANMKAGQMFTVKIVPRSKRIDVFVVGTEFAKAQFSDLGLEASIKVGTRTWTLKPDRQKDHFSIFTPDFSTSTEDTQLLLKVRASEKTEDFKFPLDRR